MIKYSLVCSFGHEFEGWFSSSKDFENQKRQDFVTCPSCGSCDISKTIMAPNVGTRSNKGSGSEVAEVGAGFGDGTLEKLRLLKKEIEKNAEDVGSKFPEEARKIHYGEAKARGIYGKASQEEAISLHEEGVEFLPIPELPEDKN